MRRRRVGVVDLMGNVRPDLGPLWNWLPAGGLEHDAKAYAKSVVAG